MAEDHERRLLDAMAREYFDRVDGYTRPDSLAAASKFDPTLSRVALQTAREERSRNIEIPVWPIMKQQPDRALHNLFGLLQVNHSSTPQIITQPAPLMPNPPIDAETLFITSIVCEDDIDSTAKLELLDSAGATIGVYDFSYTTDGSTVSAYDITFPTSITGMLYGVKFTWLTGHTGPSSVWECQLFGVY